MNDSLIETQVTYTLEIDGKFYLIERVPAWVCPETGEQFFSPETVERIEQLIHSGHKPVKTIKTPVFEYA